MVVSALCALVVGICTLLGSWYYLFDGSFTPLPSFNYTNLSFVGLSSKNNAALPLPNVGREDTSMGMKTKYSSLKAEYTYNFGLPLSEAVVPPKPIETILSSNDLDQIMKGKWILLVYAEWCPNSQNMLQIFNEFIAIAEKLVLEQREKLPNIARITVGQSSELAAATFIDKIPTLLLIEDGKIRITPSNYSNASAFLELSLSEWTKIPKSYSIKLNLSRVSFYDVWSIKAFDLFGKHAFPLQETIITWINNNKQYSYSILITAISSLFILRRLGWIKFIN